MTRKVDCLIYCLKFFDTQSQNSKQTANYKYKLAFMVSMTEKLDRRDFSFFNFCFNFFFRFKVRLYQKVVFFCLRKRIYHLNGFTYTVLKTDPIIQLLCY